MAPDAVRAPPMLSTARNEICTDRPAMLPASALHFAARTPARQAASAASSTRCFSRCSAPDAFTIRNAPNVRSSEAPISPTASCAPRDALLMRGMTTPITRPATTSTAAVTSSSTRSTRPISTTVAIRVNTPVTPETSDWVTTDRSSVVSEVTRDIRSPGSAPSTADSRRRSSRSSS